MPISWRHAINCVVIAHKEDEIREGCFSLSSSSQDSEVRAHEQCFQYQEGNKEVNSTGIPFKSVNDILKQELRVNLTH